MAMQKRSDSLHEKTTAGVSLSGKRFKRGAPAGLRELDARDRALEQLGAGVEIPAREVNRWLKLLTKRTS